MNRFLSVIALALLVGVILYSDPKTLADALVNADIFLLIAGSLVMAIILGLNAYRFHMLSRPLGVLSLKEAANVVFFSQLINQGAVAALGEVSKGALLKKRQGTSLSRTLGVVLVERGQDVLFSVMFSMFLFAQYKPDWLLGVALFSAGTVAFFGFLVFLPISFFSFLTYFGEKPLAMLKNFRMGVNKQPPTHLLASVGITLIALLLGGVANLLFFQALGVQIDFWMVMSINSAGLLIGFLSGLPAGIGSRETAFVFLYGLFGVSAAVVIATALLVRIVFMAESVVGFILSESQITNNKFVKK